MKVQHFFQNHKYILLAAVILLGVAWSGMMVNLIIRTIREWQKAHVEVVELRSPAPAMNLPMVQGRGRRQALPVAMPVMQKYDNTTAFPVAAMEGTMVKMSETSAARVSHVGGGMAAPAMSNQTTTTNRNIALNNASVSFTSMIYLNTAHSAVTSVGASQANEVVNEKMGIVARRDAKMDGFPDPPDGPIGPIDPTPVSATPWLLMLLLTTAWGVRARLKKQ